MQVGCHPRTLNWYEHYITPVALARDGRLAIYGSSDKTLKLWDLTRPDAKPRTLKGLSGEVTAVAITPDGRLVASGSWDKTLKVWDLNQPNANPRTLKGHADRVTAVALSRDGHLAASGSDDITLRVWDLTNYQLLSMFTGQSKIDGVSISEDGRMIFAVCRANQIYILQLEDLEISS